MRLSMRLPFPRQFGVLSVSSTGLFLIGLLSLQSPCKVSAQEFVQQRSSVGCDGRSECHGASKGYYIPSLQTLLMMPLSHAGDRLEASWMKRVNRAPSVVVSRIQCDSWIEPPSYALDEQAPDEQAPDEQAQEETRLRESSASMGAPLHPTDAQELLASQWAAPVKVAKVAPNVAKSAGRLATPQGLERFAEPEPAVVLAGGTNEPANGVRLTGNLEVRDEATGGVKRAADIKLKYQQRKTASSLGPNSKAIGR
jgi:hypothetical protein